MLYRLDRILATETRELSCRASMRKHEPRDVTQLLVSRCSGIGAVARVTTRHISTAAERKSPARPWSGGGGGVLRWGLWGSFR
jgi:hypothetical protein